MSGMELKQNLKLTQQLIMTPRLQLAIKMLAMNNVELSEMIKQEIAENPVIDMDAEMDINTDKDEGIDLTAVDDGEINKVVNGDGAAARNSENSIDYDDGVSQKFDDVKDEASLFDGDASYFKEILNYVAEYDEQLSDLSQYSKDENRKSDKDYIIENSLRSSQSLYEFIMEQVMTGDFYTEEIELFKYIAGNLDAQGFLSVSRQEILNFAAFIINSNPNSKFCGALESFVDSALNKFGRFEPVGLAAENTVASLLIQADVYFHEDNLLKSIIGKHLKDVANKNYSKIVKEEKSRLEFVLVSVEKLKRLSPRPAANFGQSESRFITPDMYLKKINGKWTVAMDDDFVPQIKINSYYRQVLNGEAQSSQDMKDYVENKFKSALWLIKSIATRKETILKIAQSIIDRQASFFDSETRRLNPLILRDIAMELNIHESTVSRATANKYIGTDIGVFELKSFFSGASFGDSSSDSVMAKIKDIIKKEKVSNNIYCDSDIVDILKKEGINIARRTVAKYREILNIPTSVQRKNLQNQSNLN